MTVAVVSNPLITGQMIPLTQSVFEKENPGITVKFATYTEGDLRAAIEKNVSTHSNAFNVVMIGPYETPLFAKNGWLDDLTSKYIAKDPAYDASDLLHAGGQVAVLQGRPVRGAVLRRVLDALLPQGPAGGGRRHHAAASHLGPGPAAAAKLNQPGKQSGICLRGLAGWGDNMASLDTVINTFGGQWFDSSWQPQLTSPAFTRPSTST